MRFGLGPELTPSFIAYEKFSEWNTNPKIAVRFHVLRSYASLSLIRFAGRRYEVVPEHR